MKKLVLCFFAVTALFISCKKEDCDQPLKTLKGPVVKVHDGKAWTWVQINKKGNPEKMAIAIDDAALNSMQIDKDGGPGHGHDDVLNNWILKFHPQAVFSPFDHVGLDWNRSGHEPDPIYGVPHFDLHFYMISAAAVDAIPPYELDSLKFKNWPAPAYFPANYFNAGGGVPKMGAHWVDPTSSEFQGQPFTQTFVYGSYNGRVTFYEPMITLAFLKATSNFTRSIPQPAKFQQSGWYPTRLTIQKTDGVTEIILSAFVLKAAA